MKKIINMVMVVALAAGLAACGNSSNEGATSTQQSTKTPAGTDTSALPVTVISREDGSGTRGAFIELFGMKEGDEDKTTPEAAITNSTSVMMTMVAGDESAIGYISLGSMNDMIKAVPIDGAEATVENIQNETYKIARPFNIATKEGTSDTAKDFIAYIMSKDGQGVIEKNGYISAAAGEAYKASNAKGKVVVAGSSSVTPVMEKLKEAYTKLNPDVNVEIQQSDSSTGMQSAIDGICDIGMASRELKDSEKSAGLTPTVIAMDGIAVIVNNANTVDGLTSEQVKAIFTGETMSWSEIVK